MTIKLVSASDRLTATRRTIYTCPMDCISATVAGGTVTHIKESVDIAHLNLLKGGSERWIVQKGEIPYHGSPWTVPVITLLPGQTIEAWSDADGLLDINLTIGEQR